MDRAVPLWLELQLLLFGSLATATSGWAVESRVEGSDRAGISGQASVKIARLPAADDSAVEGIFLRADPQELERGWRAGSTVRQHDPDWQANGDIVLELLDTRPGSDTLNDVISDLMWLPLDTFAPEESRCVS